MLSYVKVYMLATLYTLFGAIGGYAIDKYLEQKILKPLKLTKLGKPLKLSIQAFISILFIWILRYIVPLVVNPIIGILSGGRLINAATMETGGAILGFATLGIQKSFHTEIREILEKMI